jgi:hypothetical protein
MSTVELSYHHARLVAILTLLMSQNNWIPNLVCDPGFFDRLYRFL